MNWQKLKTSLKGNTGLVVIGVAILAAFLPDPLDFLDAGSPLLESAVAIATIIIRMKK